ncbi:Hypothetical predicted protein, partial [Mytilus galloprovincialis]
DESSNESVLNQDANPRSIKNISLNVCGIISKLKFPDLEEKCADYDILCFCESKLDNLDEVEFSNFVKLPPLNRKGAKHKSGGIVVFVKEFLYSNIEVLECSSENALWFIVNNILYEPVLFGACYIPPERSDYSSIDIFDVIETELLKYAVDKNCKVCLLGDFNAHTGKKDDFVEMNHYVSESAQLDKEIKQNFDFVDLDALEKVKKPWFNRECAEKRKLYHRAKNYNWRVKTAESKTNLTVCSKEYKKVLCNQYRLYNKNFIKKLKNLRQNDCKSYWNLLNRACSSQTKQNIVNKVSLDCFYNHFKKLNSAQDENDDTFENIDVDNITSLNTEVNRAISENEVRQAIKGLKNNKACGNDLIINEFLKHSADKMLPVFIALFNIVFESGCIPDSWSEGIIVPIYKCKGDPANPDNYRGITVLSCF